MDAERDTAPLYSSSSECHLTERQQEEMKFDMNHGGVGVCDALRRALSHCSPISREAPCSSWWPSISVYHVPCECCNNELRDYTAEDRYGKGVLVCPSDYDGYLCWNHARAGTRVSHSCRAVSSPVLFTENEHGTRHMVTRMCGADGKWVPEPRGARFSQMLPLLEMFRMPPTPNGTLSIDELIAAKGAYAERLRYSNYDDCLPTVTKALLGAPEYAADFNLITEPSQCHVLEIILGLSAVALLLLVIAFFAVLCIGKDMDWCRGRAFRMGLFYGLLFAIVSLIEIIEHYRQFCVLCVDKVLHAARCAGRNATLLVHWFSCRVLAVAIEFTGTLFALWSGIYVLSLCYVLLKYAFVTWRSRAAFRAEAARIGGREFNELQAFGEHTPSSAHSMSALALSSGAGGGVGGGSGGGKRFNGLGLSPGSSVTRGRDHPNRYPGTSSGNCTKRSRELSLERGLETESTAATSVHQLSMRSLSLSLNYNGSFLDAVPSEHEERYSPTTITESSPAIDGSSEIAASQATCAEAGTGTRRGSFTCRDHVQLFLVARNSVSHLFMRHFLHLVAAGVITGVWFTFALKETQCLRKLYKSTLYEIFPVSRAIISGLVLVATLLVALSKRLGYLRGELVLDTRLNKLLRELIQASLVFGVSLLDSVFNYWLPHFNLLPIADTSDVGGSRNGTSALELTLFIARYVSSGVLPGAVLSTAVLVLDADVGSLLGRLLAKLRAERSGASCCGCGCVRWWRRGARNGNGNSNGAAGGGVGVVRMRGRGNGRSHGLSADRTQHWAELSETRFMRVSPTSHSFVNNASRGFLSCCRPAADSRRQINLPKSISKEPCLQTAV